MVTLTLMQYYAKKKKKKKISWPQKNHIFTTVSLFPKVNTCNGKAIKSTLSLRFVSNLHKTGY